MRRVRTVLAVTVLIVPVLCRAQESGELDDRLKLGAAIAYARRHNPEIAAAEAKWHAAQARPSQEGSLADPMINTAYHNEGFDRLRQGSGDFTFLRFGAEQEVPFPGKLALKEKVAFREADREGALYRATVLNVVTRLRIAYDDYYLAHKSIEILSRNKELLDQLARAAEARYQVGEGLQQDVVRAQLELSILTGRLTSLEQARQSVAAMVNALLNRPPAEPLGIPAPVEKRPLPYSLDQLEKLAQQQSPSLEAAKFGVDRAEANLDLAKRQYYPDFVVRADYFNKASLVPEWEVGAGIRVPLYFWRKQSSGVVEATASVSAARASRQGTSQEVLATLKDFYAQASSAARLMELYDAVVGPQAEIALESASAAYQVGKVDFLSVLTNFTILNDYRLRYYGELANFDKALARLEEAAGMLPDESLGDESPPSGSKRGK